MTMISMIVGAVTDTTARFAVRATTGPVRVAYSASPSMTSPSYSASAALSSGAAQVQVSGLTPDTRYWWQVEDGGVLDASATGQLLTDPPLGEPASFTVATCGDAGLTPRWRGVAGAAPQRLSNHPVFDTIRTRALAEGWRRVCHLGDMCYYDLGSGNHGLSASATAAQYRGQWDDILAQPRQAALYRQVSLAYVWDDHDFGPNDSNSGSPGRSNACTVYRERMPSYPLPAGAGANPIYQSWQIGRVLFIASDVRSDRVPGTTMLGAPQIAWMESVLSTSDAAALVWLMPVPWLGMTSDNWQGFPAEKAALVQMLGDLGWLDRMVQVSADKHVLAMESGRGGNASGGGFPIMLCASLDASIGSYTTQYDIGMWPGRNQYGTVTVRDDGGDIAIGLTAWRHTRPVAWTYATTSTRRSVPPGPPSHVIAP